jgi:hypothetical protein
MAWRESMLLIRHLQRRPAHFRRYFGTLKVLAPIGIDDFIAIVKAFRKGMGKRFGAAVQYRPFIEVGPRCGGLHLHYAMTSDGVDVAKADVAKAWNAAGGGRGVRVKHEPMRDVPRCIRYLCKADDEHHQHHDPADPSKCVVLFAKCSPRLPQATAGFFPGKIKAELWQEWKAEDRARRAARRHQASETTATAPFASTDASVLGEADSHWEGDPPAVAPVTPRTSTATSTRVLAAAPRPRRRPGPLTDL